MSTDELIKERDIFWGGVFKDRAHKWLADGAAAHFDSTPELQKAFACSPIPTPGELAAGKKRYVESFLRQVRSDLNCPPSLK